MKKNKTRLKEEALKKIIHLFKEAKSNPSKANWYINIARKTAMKVNLKIPKEFKRRYCKHCNNYFLAGNYRARTRNKMLVYCCFKCKKYMKFSLVS